MGWAAFPWFPDDPRVVSYEEVLTIADRGLNCAKRAEKNCAVGMSPARGNSPATTIARPHSAPLAIDTFAVVGPPPAAP